MAGSTKTSATSKTKASSTSAKTAAVKSTRARKTTAKTSASKTASAKTSSAKTSSTKTSSAKTSSAKKTSTKTSPAKTSSAKTAGTAKKTEEINLFAEGPAVPAVSITREPTFYEQSQVPQTQNTTSLTTLDPALQDLLQKSLWGRTEEQLAQQEKESKNRLLFLVLLALFAFLAFVGVGTGVFFALKYASLSNANRVAAPLAVNEPELAAVQRDNRLSLARQYIEQGLYDNALNVLGDMLVRDAEDSEAKALLEQTATLKREAEQLASLTSGDPSVMEGTLGMLAEQLAGQNSQNEAVEELIRQQQLNAESARAESQAQAQKAQEEAERAKKDEAFRQLSASINDEIAKGTAALNSGHVDDGLSHFNNAKNQLPANDPSYSASKLGEMARLLYDASQERPEGSMERKRLSDSAASFAQEAIAKGSSDAASLYVMGMRAFDAGNLSEAEKQLRAAISSDSTNYLYYYQLGRVQARLGKFSEAKTSFSSSVKYNSSFASSQYNLGIACARLNQTSQALAAYRRAFAIDPTHENAYLAAARILVKEGNVTEGISIFEQAVSVNPSNASTYKELGSAYASVGKDKAAEDAYKHAISLQGPGEEDPATYYNLSTVMLNQGKSSEAVSYAKKAYDTRTASSNKDVQVNSIYNYALILDATGNATDAMSLYQQVIKEDPSHVKAMVNLAVLFLNENDADSALVLLNRAYSLQSTNFEVNNNMGNAYRMNQNYDKAIPYYVAALKIQPKDNTVRINLAKTYASAENYDLARATYEDVIKLDPKDYDSMIELAKVCIALKDTESAKGYLTVVQQQAPSHRRAEVTALLSSL